MPRTLRLPIKARLNANLSALRRNRFPVWTTGRAMLVSTLTAGSCSALFFVMNASPLVEMETFLATISACLMLFLTWGLYAGARVKRETQQSATFSPPELKSDEVVDGWHNAADVPMPDLDEGCLGAIAVLVLWLVITLFLIGLLAPLLNVFLAVFAIVLSAVFWVFYRALRVTLVRGRRCRGNLLSSIGYAAFSTFLYTGWLFAIVRGAGLLAERKLGG
jgi:lysylphosphatidylglycerol synthetase-like protein (DUF2156 family)